MAQKQLINSIEKCVEESLFGFSKLRQDLSVDLERKVVVDLKFSADRKVAVISGGGSGHEPFPAGFVGEGMLTASVSGSIFTSPPSKHVLHCIRLVAAKSSGVLLLVPNYTGDVLNFGLAAETALGEGMAVESVVVGEDVAQEARGMAAKAGKRGMCGLVLAIKIAGHLARLGHDLTTVKKLSAEAAGSTASMGLCVSACCKPGVGLLFRLGDDEMEVGVGVHGEAGIARVEMLPAREAVDLLLRHVLRSLGATEGDEVVALLNDLGSLSCMEQWLLAGELESLLSERKIKVVRLYAGRFFTSLNMAGVQICLLKLNRGTKETFLAALDHPTTASAWTNLTHRPRVQEIQVVATRETKKTSSKWRLPPEKAAFLRRCFARASEALKNQETLLNQLDTVGGDGDCGTTFALLADLLSSSATEFDFSDPAALFCDLSLATQGSVGGTTGALYGLFFKGCGEELAKHDGSDEASAISKCWRAGVETIKKYSSARVGDRTMLDSLETGCLAFETQLEKSQTLQAAFESALEAAKKGCEGSKFLQPLAGRAGYTDSSRQNEVDPGAHAVTVWLSAIQLTSEEK